jgi:dTDP-4-amino-4,6-dideoxygalactose transaminase
MKIEAFPQKVWLASPTMHGDEMQYISKAYETNWMSTEGENLKVVESLVCEKVGCKYAVPLSSGTAALHLAVKLAGIEQGDTVFCSDVTFAATVNAIRCEKAIPVFIDSEYETWNMDPVALEKAFELYPDTKAVVVVNLYGTPARFDEICEIAKKHGAVIIEDAAESFGATYKGRQTGTFGSYNVISFNGNKIITGSSGGALLTDDENAAQKAQKWSTQSREDANWYQHTEVGYNYRMSNLIAGVIRGQMPHLEEHIAQKKAIYERYLEGFKGLPVSMNPFDANTMEPNYWLSCMVVDGDYMTEQKRSDTQTSYRIETGKTCPDEILDALLSINAQGRPVWKPMHMQPLYENSPFVTASGLMDKTAADTSVGADIFQRGLCLPSDNKMTVEEQEKIIQQIRNCFD